MLRFHNSCQIGVSPDQETLTLHLKFAGIIFLSIRYEKHQNNESH